MSGGTPVSISGKADITLTTDGDTLYYNSGRQRLAKGTDNQVLTLASGLPSWATSGGGGQLELLDTHEATGTESTYTYTPSTALDLGSTYDEIIVIAKGKTSGSLAIDFKLNGLTEYHTSINNNLLGTLTGIHLGSALNAELQSSTNINVGRGFNLNLHISKELSDGGSIGYNYYGFSNVSTRALTTFAGGTIANTDTTISSIQLFTSNSTWKAGTTINTYGVKKV